eukprot:4237652-Amphidinium_carterae.1
MEQLVQQMTLALQAIQQQNSQHATAFNRTLDLLTEQQQRQQETLAAITAGRMSSFSTRRVVEVKQVGKPDVLSGNKDAIARAWPSWSFMFSTWFCSHFELGEKALEWCKGATNTIGHTEITHKSTQQGWSDLGRLNAQLHVAVVSLCRDEAL